MKKTQPDLTSGLGWLGTILTYIKEYGVLNIIRAIILFIIFFLTLKICYDPSFLFETYKTYKETIHQIETTEREKIDREIKLMLPGMLYKYHADRVWIIQCHNGISDWRFGSMRFEMCKEGVESIKEQYLDFPLSWIDLYYYLKEHKTFIGNVEKLKSVDKTLYDRFLKNDVHYVACILVQDEDGQPSGVLGYTWTDETHIQKYEDKIREYLWEDKGTLKSYLKPIIYKF